MYLYDDADRRLVRQRAAEFRDQVARYRAGTLDEDRFRDLRLRNGLYQELHAPMLRVAIPYGLLSARQLRALADIARRFDRGYGHFTTRQNIQFNWQDIDTTPDVLDALAEVDMHAIQTSGNVVRNVSTDHLAGVAADEQVDPRPYCEIIRQWSTLNPEFHWLPRKFKIALTGASSDRAAIRLHDIGLQVCRGDDGAVGFRVFVGGGQGRTPRIAALIPDWFDERHLLAYLTAILRIYNLHGRRDNKHRARIKILLGSMGEAAFRAAVEAEFEHIVLDPRQHLQRDTVEYIGAMFAPPDYQTGDSTDLGYMTWLRRDDAFARWVQHNTEPHRVPGYRIVTVPLKAEGAAPGDASAAQMVLLADLAERYSFGQIRVSHMQNLVLADVREADLPALWTQLATHDLAAPVRATLADMICCPGLDYCSLANARSIPVAQAIRERFAALDRLYALGEIELKMSGCMNACGHHHVGHIGILGVEKGGAEWYQLTLGGAPGNDAAVGERLGPAIAADAIVDAVEQLIACYVEQRQAGERFIDTYRRIGPAPFKEKVYEQRDQGTARERRQLAVRVA